MFNLNGKKLTSIKPGWTIAWRKEEKVITLLDKNNNTVYWDGKNIKMDVSFLADKFDFSQLARIIALTTHGLNGTKVISNTSSNTILEFI